MSRPTLGDCEVRLLKLVSQEWQGITREDDVVVIRPSGVPIN
jgi:hypothetical protein